MMLYMSMGCMSLMVCMVMYVMITMSVMSSFMMCSVYMVYMPMVFYVPVYISVMDVSMCMSPVSYMPTMCTMPMPHEFIMTAALSADLQLNSIWPSGKLSGSL